VVPLAGAKRNPNGQRSLRMGTGRREEIKEDFLEEELGFSG
jgi:hypothetical protein